VKNIRNVIPTDGVIPACIPNAQHWSAIVRLALGDFRYEESGLLDKTHLRWFTRMTMIEMFEKQGFRIVEVFPRVFNETNREKFLPVIKEIVKVAKMNPEIVMNDLISFQYIVKAIPA
jgi:hypothetical protein